MRQIKLEELSPHSFSPFGSYVDPRNCGPALNNGSGPVLFYPDRILLLFEDSDLAAVSPLVIRPRDWKITVTEIHVFTEEAFGGFTRDVVFHVGPAGSHTPDPAQFRVFRLPATWWVRLKCGVWHHGPFVIGQEDAVGTVVLPPATYTNDSIVVNLEESVAIEQ